MKTEDNVIIEVFKTDIKEWFDAETIYRPILREIRFDHEMHPLQEILLQDDIYLIRYRRINSDDKSNSLGEPRTFITDLEHVIDFTWIDILTKLEGCDVEETEDYPQELNNLLTEYCFGSGYYRLSLENEYRKFKKYRHIDLSVSYFDEKIEKENDCRIYKCTRKEHLFLSSLKVIFDHYDRGEMINLDEIYWQFGEKDNPSPYRVLTTPFFMRISERTRDEFDLKPKQVQRCLRGQMHAHMELAWYYLTILCEDVVLNKSFWETQNEINDPRYAIKDIDGTIERYKEIFRSFRENSDLDSNSQNQTS